MNSCPACGPIDVDLTIHIGRVHRSITRPNGIGIPPTSTQEAP